ncbi:helix-turn-helix transcriptional regulator, partial [Methylobacterium trifolii]
AARSGPADALLAQGYGLTAAEIRLVQDLARDRDLAEIAARSRVTVATLRSQLKTVFAKTGTHRQSQLVNLVSRLSLRA